MSFRFRKSFQIMPGLRMTVTKTGVGVSIGGFGTRLSLHSSGRVTRTVGVPGTGLYYTSTARRPRTHSRSTRTADAAPPTQLPTPIQQIEPRLKSYVMPEPGLLSRKWERTFAEAFHEFAFG